MNARITMNEVARAAGVHQTTVSLALRNHPSIPPATRDRIRTLADELGYRPNPLVSALIAERRRGRASGQGTTLAFLTCFAEKSGWRHSANYVAIHEELKAHAGRCGYQLEEFWLTAPGMTPARLRDILFNRGIRGIIVCPMPDSIRTLDFDFTGFTALALGLTLESPRLDRVTIDYHAVMSLCVNQLKARGRRRIGFATTLNIDSRVNHLSLGAFLAERHLSPRRFVAPFTPRDWDAAAFSHWIKTTRPDALITAITPDYLWLQPWLAAIAPRQRTVIDLVCVDCNAALPGQPGVIQDLTAEARTAIDWVTSHLERAQFGIPASPQTIGVGGTWRDA